MTRLLFDIETNGLLDEVTTVHCVVIKDLDTGQMTSYPPEIVPQAVERLEQADELWGHNIMGYDLLALNKVFPWFIPKGLIRDTLLLSRLVWSDIKQDDFRFQRKNPSFPGKLIGTHSLEAWGHRLKLLKGDFGKTSDWSTYSAEMLEYCELDVEVNHKLIERIAKENPSEESVQLEHDFAKIILLQERNGVGFDVRGAQSLHAELSALKNDLEVQLQQAFGPREILMKTPAYYLAPDGKKFPTKKAGMAKGWKSPQLVAGPPKVKVIPFNPGSRKQIAERLTERYGWKPKKHTENGTPVIDEQVLAGLDYPETNLLADYLLVSKRLGQLIEGKEAWIAHERDGKIHGGVITNGTVSGRCSHRNPNMSQVPSVSKDAEGEVKWGIDGGWGYECRALFRPTYSEWVMVGADASGLELRNLAHFMAKYDGGEYVKVVTEGDVHTTNQQAAGFYLRASAKTFIYAYGYGAADPKLGSIAKADAKDAGKPVPKGSNDEIGKALRAQFEAKLPAMGTLVAKVKRAAGFMPVTYTRGGKTKTYWKKDPAAKRDYLIGLDGRKLPVRSAHSALNTLLQSAGAVIMKKALVILYESLTAKGWKHGVDYAFMLNVHDEFQLEVRPEIADEIGYLAVESIRSAGVHFNFRCPLDGEYKIGKNWAETH